MADNIVADIKDRLSVEVVVGRYLDLRPAGANLKALSPFKTEKTPSLVVTPAKQIWKDFSSGKGGDIFTFISEIESVDFAKAIEILAPLAGLNIDDYRQISPRQKAIRKKQQELYDLLDKVAQFYHRELLRQMLKKDQSIVGRYYKKRGFNKDVCQRFLIGYAPAGWQALVAYLKKEKISLQLAKEAGLVKIRGNKQQLSDQFVDRLVVPLSDNRGRTIGFTGRIVNDQSKAPKYINSPTSLVYNKSRHVFGYYQARLAASQAANIVIVEGNFDVLTAHQFGYLNVVATGGTALTVEHFKAVKNLNQNIILAFDGDSAGLAATERALPLAKMAEINLSIIGLEDGLDPDDLIRKDKKQWESLQTNALGAIDWLMAQYEKRYDLKIAANKRHFSDQLLPAIASLNDPVEIDSHLNELAKKTTVSKEAILTKYEAVKKDLATKEAKKSFSKPRQSQPAVRTTTAAPVSKNQPSRSLARPARRTTASINQTAAIAASRRQKSGLIKAILTAPKMPEKLNSEEIKLLKKEFDSDQKNIWELLEKMAKSSKSETARLNSQYKEAYRKCYDQDPIKQNDEDYRALSKRLELFFEKLKAKN